MNFDPKRPISALLSAVMLLGIASPPAQALDPAPPSDDTHLCSHHTEHTQECGSSDGSCTFVCPEYAPQTLPELHEDMIDGGQPEKPEQSEQSDLIPLVPATPAASTDTIPALSLTPAKPIEDTQLDETDPIIEPAEPIVLLARARDEVYTSITGGNHSHHGNGTQANPYNLFTDAVENVMPGGTIIIKNKAFLNTLNETGSLPYIIDKNITIRSEDPNRPAMLQVRAGGIVLGNDVTFENVNFNFENRVHDAIFANGHTLTLKNVTRSNGSREVDLFGGQLYENGTPYAINKKSDCSQIIIEMKDPKLAPLSSLHLGNIYAGSMNGPFDGDVTINVSDSNQGKTKFIGEVYASGAKEADPGNMLDIKEPKPPEADPIKYPTSGTVTMNFDSLPLRGSSASPMLIDGNTGNGGKTDLSVSVSSPTSNLKLENTSALIVKSGVIQPTKDSTPNFDSIKIESGAELDLSLIPAITTKTLSGEGTLTLKKDGTLDVTNSFDKSTLIFQTEGAWNGKSGTVIADHTYVSVPTASTGKFSFKPHTTQSTWTLTEDTNELQKKKWVPKGTENPDTTAIEPLVKFEIAPDKSHKTVNQSYLIDTHHAYNERNIINFPLTTQDISGNVVDFLDYYSFTCEIDGRIIPPTIDTTDNSYILDYSDPQSRIVLQFSVDDYDQTPTLNVSLITDHNSDAPIEPFEQGEHKIVLSTPSASGKILQAIAYLTVTEDPPAPPLETPDSGTSNSIVNVTKPSPTTFGESITVEATIEQAVMFSTRAIESGNAYLYINGKPIGNPVAVSTESFQFDKVPVTLENGFRAGENQISVVYGGGNITALGAFNGSTGSTKLTVNKALPKITVNKLDPITKKYDGTAMDYTPDIAVQASGIQIDNPNVTVTYKNTNDSTSHIQSPVLPGTYTTVIEIAEGNFYQKASAVGSMITIEKARPKVSVSHSFTENNKVVLQATLQGVDRGIPPTGEVTFKIGDKTQKTEVRYGVATVQIDKPAIGKHTITATYTPSTDSADIYETASGTSELNIVANHQPLTGITLNQQALTLKKDTSADLKVFFQPENASNTNVTWTSTRENVATVDIKGKVTALSSGTTTIHALSEEGGHIASCVVTVTDHEITVTKVKLDRDKLFMALNETDQLAAIIEPYNATNQAVTWESSDSNIVSVDENTGVVTAKAATNHTPVRITATVGGQKAYCDITVSDNIPVTNIKLNTQKLSFKANETVKLTANITPYNASNQKITWKSSSEDVTVDSAGWVTSSKEGATATITATVDGKDASCQITVTKAGAKVDVTGVTVSPKTLELDVEQEQQLSFDVQPMHATNKKIRWTSEYNNIASVDDNGLVTAHSAGTTKITVTTEDQNKTAICVVTVNGTTPPPTPDSTEPKIEINPNHLDLTVGQAGTFKATVTNGDSTPVRWEIQEGDNIITLTSSADGKTATVTADKGDKTGRATVKAIYTKSDKTVSTTATVEVTEKTQPANPIIIISPDKMDLNIGSTSTFNAQVTNGTSGTVTWSVTQGSDFIALQSLGNGETAQVTAKKAGDATVQATYTESGKSVHATATVKVTDTTMPNKPAVTSVQIKETDLSLKPGEKSKFTVTVSPSEAEQAIIWSSNAPSIVSVDRDTGEIAAQTPGQAVITAASAAFPDKTDSKTVTVIDVPVTEVKINESILSLRRGDSTRLTVKVTPDNATDPRVKWESNDTDILSVTQDGYITAHRKGTATITVSSVAQSELKDSRTISVTASSSGGGSSSGGSSHRPSKPNNKPTKPETKPENKPEVKPQTPPVTPPPVIPPSVKPELPKPGVPVITTPPPVDPALNTSFDDIKPTHWASEPIKDVVSRGLFVGTEPNEFSPNETMSRGMLVTVLHRLAGEPPVQAVNQFTDVGRTYYTDAVTWASQNHIVSGTSADTFSPNLMVTREELVVMLYRVANPVPGTTADLSGFADTSKVSSWASAPMQWAVKTEILKGSNGALLPQQKLTRAEAASLISRFTEKVLHA